MRYKKKPIIIEAMQYTGNNEDIVVFTQGSFLKNSKGDFLIKTLEGNMYVSVGDFIIKGIKGEFYPCKPDIFEATYDKIEAEPKLRRALSRIQKAYNLNTVFCDDAEHPLNKGHHKYMIRTVEDITLQFQNGARNEEGSIPGILDTDLLEIVRDRIASFQNGPYATRENQLALTHLETALLWMNKRVQDRAEKNTLGTHKI